MWSLATQSALVAVIISAATTAALLLRARRALYVRFGAFALSVGAYYLTALVSSISRHNGLIEALSMLCAGSAVITAALFFDGMAGDVGLIAKKRRKKTVICGVLIIAISMTGLAHNFWIRMSLIALTVFLLSARMTALWRRSKQVKSTADGTRLRYLAYAGFIALFAFCLDLGAQMGWHVPPIGGVVVACYLYFISQVLVVSRLLDLHELFGKGVVFACLALILAGLYGILVVWADSKPGLFLFNTLIASSLILILYEPLKSALEQRTAKMFFKEHFTFALHLRQAARQVANIVELQPAIDLVLNEIYDRHRATHASVYIFDADGMRFSLQGYRGPKPGEYLEGMQHPVLFRRILHGRDPILQDAISRRVTLQRESEDKALLTSLQTMQCELLVPFKNGDILAGFLILQDDRLSENYSKDEISALAQLGEQLAITIQNSRVFTVLKERDRLAAIGEMSAGLAHEIRNPLTAIKGAAQALDPDAIKGEDGELLKIIVDEVNRLNNVVTEFLDYSRPFRGSFSPLQINDIALKTVKLLEHGLSDSIELQLDLEPNLVFVNGDPEQLRQVLINLILNAQDAMNHAGILRISTRERKGQEDGNSYVELRVQDSGNGIPPRIRDKIFIPFFTTKQGGTGLGLALCQRIIREHGGNIEVRTVQGKGTTFVVRIPSVKSQARMMAQPMLPLNRGYPDVLIAN